MSGKTFLTAYLPCGSEVKIHGGWRHREKGYHAEVERADGTESYHKSISVWELTFPIREMADAFFLVFFEVTTEEAIKIDRRRGVIKKGCGTVKIKEAYFLTA